ncbi:MAG: M15 family metallopeptidase [Pseudomonadota bacterium]
MLIFVALLYFFLVCGAAWLLLFPAGRRFVVRLVAGIGARFDAWHELQRREVAQLSESGAHFARRQARFVRRHPRMLGAGAAALLVPACLVWWSGARLPAYEGKSLPPDAQVAALLRGEQLVAPQALPPMAFTTEEVELVRPMLVDASRNWAQLTPEFKQRLLLVFRVMKEKHGYDMALLEGYRSPARQDLLARMGSSVTNAGAFQSYHQYGLAADCAFWRDGKLLISEKDPWAMRGYRLYGEVAESLGLTWGGRWTMMDFGHTELRLPGVRRK